VHLLTALWSDAVFLSFTAIKTPITIPNYWITQPNKGLNPVYKTTLLAEFKTLYTIPEYHKTAAYKTSSTKKPFTTNNNQQNLTHQFFTYLRVNTRSNSTLVIPHFSFRHFYIAHTAGGLSVLNVRKLFTRWKDSYFLLFNLFYYKVETLSFATSFFQNEVLAMNWQVLKQFRFIWRYTKPFLFLKSTKINNFGDFIFYRLNLLGLRVAWLTDVAYHNKSLYYLHRAGFYTIALTPTNYNAYSVNFAVPTAYDSIFTQLFFVRFTLSIQQQTQSLRFNQIKRHWTLNSCFI